MQEESITRAIIVVQMGMTPSAKQVKLYNASCTAVLYLPVAHQCTNCSLLNENICWNSVQFQSLP